MTRSKPLFIADWVDAIFLHFAIDPKKLRPLVPMELDRFDGEAFVSLVAFTQRNLRPRVGGALAAWLATPLATHEFLNVRTYVRHGDLRGIYFLAEWIPNRLAALIGPRTYGLPYRLGRLDYQPCVRRVSEGISTLKFQIERPNGSESFCQPRTLDHFLLERYTAFTHRHGVIRRFDVAHEPWPMRHAAATIEDSALLSQSGDWYPHARLMVAHASVGVRDVSISAPKAIRERSAANSSSPPPQRLPP